MQFQVYSDPMGTKLSHDKQLIENQKGLMELAIKKQALDQSQRLADLLTGGGPKPAASSPVAGAADPGVSVSNDLEGATSFAKKQMEDAAEKAKMLSAFPDIAKNYTASSATWLTKYKDGLKAIEEKKQNQFKTLQRVSGIMQTPDLFEEGVRQMEATNPGLLKQAGFQADETGRYLPTPENMKLAKGLYEGSINAVERGNLANKAMSAIDREEDNRRQAEEQRQRRIREDREYNLRRQRLEQDMREDEERRRERGEREEGKRSERLVKQASVELNRSPVYKTFDNYKRAKETADAVRQELTTKGISEPITGASAMALYDSFRNLSNEYRSRTGGAYDRKLAGELEGTLQKIEKWVSTLGRETPVVGKEGAKDIIKEINRQYARVNEQVVEAELKQMDKLKSQKVPLDMFVPKGDFTQFAITAGASRVVHPETGEVLMIYKGKGYPLAPGAQ